MGKSIFQKNLKDQDYQEEEQHQEEYICRRIIIRYPFNTMKSKVLVSNSKRNRKSSRINKYLSSDLGLVLASRTLEQVKLCFSNLTMQFFRIHFSPALNSLRYYLPRIILQLIFLFRSKSDLSYSSSLALQRDQQFIEVKMKNCNSDKLSFPTTIK